jgi:hypothetical protein
VVLASLSYLMYVLVSSYVRRARYMAYRRRDVSECDQWLSFLLSPAVSLLYTFVLTPVQYYALTQLRSWSWRTRGEPLEQQVSVTA